MSISDSRKEIEVNSEGYRVTGTFADYELDTLLQTLNDHSRQRQEARRQARKTESVITWFIRYQALLPLLALALTIIGLLTIELCIPPQSQVTNTTTQAHP